MIVRLRVFGTLSLDAPDGSQLPREAFHPVRLALLALLVAAGDHGVSRDKLVALLWPESDTKRGNHSLGQALYALRQSIDSDIVVGRSLLKANRHVVTSDLFDFHDAIASSNIAGAAGLYRGPFLDGFHLRESRELEQWIDGERIKYHSTITSALRRARGVAAASDDTRVAARFARSLLEIDPASSAAALDAMNAFVAAGDPGMALDCARIHEETLRRVLEIGPDKSVMQRASEIREMLPALPASAASPVRASLPDRREYHQPSRANRWHGVLLSVIVATAIVALSVSVRNSFVAKPVHHRVVILPFRNQTGDKSFDAIGLMAAEWISGTIARTQLVPVIPTMSVAGPSEETVSDSAMIRRSQATLAVSGEYRRKGDSLEFNVILTNIADDNNVVLLAPVTLPTDRISDQLGPLREAILTSLAPIADARLAATARVTSPPPTFEAYQTFARGLDLADRRDTGCLHYYLAAYSADTSFTLALIYAMLEYGGQGNVQASDSLAQFLQSRRDHLLPYERAIVDYQRAFYQGNRSAALASLRSTVELAPGSMMAMFFYPRELLDANRVHEALQYLEALDTADEVPSTLASYWGLLASAYHRSGRYEDQLRVAQHVRTAFPSDSRYLHYQARALAALGRMPELDAALEESMRWPSIPDWGPPGLRVYLAAHDELVAHGHPLEARAALAKGVVYFSRLPDSILTIPRHQLGLAKAYYRLGQYTSAASMLDSLIARRCFHGIELIDVHAQRAFVAIKQGDTERRRIEEAWLTTARLGPMNGAATEFRAALAALRNQKDRAVGLLNASMMEGRSYDDNKHTTIEYSSLRGYPPFERWLAPKG